MSRLAAVVGVKAGWYVLRETPLPGPWNWAIAGTFDEALRSLDGYEVVAVYAPLSFARLPGRAAATGEPGARARYRPSAEKIREVRDYMKAHPGCGEFLYEVHPRVSFLELWGGYSELLAEGARLRFNDRFSLLCDIFPSQTLYEALTAFRHVEATSHDILDAFAMLWSAKRIATSLAERLPGAPLYDARGVDTAIWY